MIVSRFLNSLPLPHHIVRRPQLVLGTLVLLVVGVMSATMFGATETIAEPVDASIDSRVVPEMLPEITIADSGERTAESPSRPAAGSGALQVNREHDFDHLVAAGETLSEIAYIYKIDTEKLAAYNRISNIHAIRAGDIIKIPSLAKELQLARQQSIARVRTTTSIPSRGSDAGTPSLVIGADEQYDGRAVTAHFSIKAPIDVQLSDFQWDLGNGRKSFRPDTFWTYDAPGTYRIALSARLPDNRTIRSNEILIDVPYPTTYRTEYQSFVTLGSVREQFALQGEIVDILNYRDIDAAPIEVVSSNFDTTVYRFTRAGYYNLTIEDDGIRSSVYVFVSPMESVHVERSDLNWYRTQFNTGAQSNCGPSTVSMAVAWANGEYVPVATIRQQVGWQDDRLGATTLEELYESLRRNDVNVRFRRLYTKQDLFNVIDNGNIAIVLFETGDIPWVEGRPLQNPIGRYYTYSLGHYIVIKGYSTDKKYFIVYDPIPSDWGSNSLRYPDGISMIGRNRYYPADTLLASIRKKRSDFLEIWR